MKIVTALMICLSLYACNEDNRTEDEKYYDNLSLQQREQINQEAAKTAAKEKADSTRYALLGGLDTLKMDYTTKCNLTKGYYVLRKPIKDSADPAFMTQYKSDELLHSSHGEAGCTYPLMTAIYIFESKKIFDKYEGSSWISMCTVTPSHPTGNVILNEAYLKGDKTLYQGE